MKKNERVKKASSTAAKNSFGKIAVLSMVVMVVAAVIAIYGSSAKGAFDETDAITFQQYKATHNIENSVLFIGTYIIHKDAMTEELYEKAYDSAAASGQDIPYYKSEIGNGEWYDLSQAENVSDITADGTALVDESEIDPLFVQFYVGADGVVKNYKDEVINPFDIPSPYDLSNLPEFEQLWFQYAQSTSHEPVSREKFLENRFSEDKNVEDSDNYLYDAISTFFKLDLTDDDTKALDAKLANMYAWKQELMNAGRDEDAETVYSICAMIDAQRRAIVYDKLATESENWHSANPALGTSVMPKSDNASFGWFSAPVEYPVNYDTRTSSLVGALYDICSGSQYDEDDPFEQDSGIMDAINEANSACQTSYIEYSSKALADENTVLGHYKYIYSNNVMESKSEESLTKLRSLMNIEKDVIADKGKELTVLESDLLPYGQSQFKSIVTSGEGSDYRSAVASGKSKAVTNQILTDLANETESRRTQYQALIDAKQKRMDAADALEYVQGIRAWAEEVKGTIPNDDFKGDAEDALDKFIKYLKDLESTIKNSDGSLKDDMEKLQEQKDDLNTKRQNALDNNDLAGAAKYDALIAAVDKQMDELGGNNNAALADSLLDKAKEAAAEGNADALSNAMDALAEMGAADQMAELVDKLEDMGANAEVMAEAEAALAEAETNSGPDSLAGDGTDGDGDKTGLLGLSDDEMMSLLEGLFGMAFEDMSPGMKAEFLAVLSILGNEGYDNFAALAAKIAQELSEEGNPYIYTPYKNDADNIYISLVSVSAAAGYRYVSTGDNCTLAKSKGSLTYTFSPYGLKYEKIEGGESSEEDLLHTVVTQNNMYLRSEDAKAIFDCRAVNVPDCNGAYAVCLLSKKMDDAESKVSELKGE
ncbi:MAG: hypothetical protein J6N47_02310 [Lachnospiraceae bacterium]|nr:hypothetical protein [Lachnospiraceae bacterium]